MGGMLSAILILTGLHIPAQTFSSGPIPPGDVCFPTEEIVLQQRVLSIPLVVQRHAVSKSADPATGHENDLSSPMKQSMKPPIENRVWRPAGEPESLKPESETIIRGQSSGGNLSTRPNEPVGEVGPEVAREIQKIDEEAGPPPNVSEDDLLTHNPSLPMVPVENGDNNDGTGQTAPGSPASEGDQGNEAPPSESGNTGSLVGTIPGGSPNGGEGTYRADGTGKMDEGSLTDKEKSEEEASWLIPTLISVTVAAIGAFLYVGFIAVDYRSRYLQILRERRGVAGRSFSSDRSGMSSFYGTSHK